MILFRTSIFRLHKQWRKVKEEKETEMGMMPPAVAYSGAHLVLFAPMKVSHEIFWILIITQFKS